MSFMIIIFKLEQNVSEHVGHRGYFLEVGEKFVRACRTIRINLG